MGVEAAVAAEIAPELLGWDAIGELAGNELLGSGALSMAEPGFDAISGEAFTSAPNWMSTYGSDLGLSPTDLNPQFSSEVISQANAAGISPTDYTNILEQMGGTNTNGISSMSSTDVMNPQVQGSQASSYPDDFGNDMVNADNSTWQPGQQLDQSPQTSLDTQATSPGSNMGESVYTGPQTATTESNIRNTLYDLGKTGKEVLSSPFYQVPKTAIDLYSQGEKASAAKAALNRFNGLTDTGAPFRNLAQNAYSNPQDYFNSPVGKNLASMYGEQYKRQQAARGRRSDVAGFNQTMAKTMAGEFNNYTQGLSRFNTAPNMAGLQGLYQGAGGASANMFNTLANKDLWNSFG